MRVAWVHPSWRDLVIQRLIGAPAAREHFLSRCGIHGALLALSIAGGAAGERELPLLVTDNDWDALGDRIFELAPDLDEPEVSALLEALSAALDELEVSGAAELRALAQGALSRISRVWARAHASVPLHLLESWLMVARWLSAPPDPVGVIAAWAELLPAEAPAPEDVDGVGRFVEWLTLVALMRDNAPELLAQLGFPERMRGLLNTFLDVVEAPISRDVWPSPIDPSMQAVELISSVHPSMRARYLAERLRSLRPEPRRSYPSQRPSEPELSAEALFDVARVLRDL